MTEPLAVQISKVFDAPAKTVFEAWLAPTTLARFLKPAPGVVIEDVDVNPEVGGNYALTMVMGETRIPVHGTYTRIDRYTRLEFSWLSPQTLRSSVVEIDFEAVDPKQTRMTFRHVGFPDAGVREDHVGGWGAIVELLEAEIGVAAG